MFFLQVIGDFQFFHLESTPSPGREFINGKSNIADRRFLVTIHTVASTVRQRLSTAQLRAVVLGAAHETLLALVVAFDSLQGKRRDFLLLTDGLYVWFQYRFDQPPINESVLVLIQLVLNTLNGHAHECQKVETDYRTPIFRSRGK
jgi:hypothetical protein